MISAPSFWWRRDIGLFACALSPLGWVAGKIAERRLEAEGQTASIPIICVGNPVAGGAGKTPAARALANILKGQGRSPAFLSRGYGGRLPGPVQVKAGHSAADVGDEPLLLSLSAPAIVSRDRPAGAALAASIGADVVVMDDGFQNPSLKKDLSFLVIDAEAGIGNGMCIPAGPLRVPLGAQIGKAHGLILVGEGKAGAAVAEEASGRGLPVFRARLVPEPKAAARLRNRPVLGFAGIGRPEKFAATLRALGANVWEFIGFPDHHRFTETDARRLLARAEADDLVLVTTEKDAMRLAGSVEPALCELSEKADVLPVRMVFDNEQAVAALLARISRQ